MSAKSVRVMLERDGAMRCVPVTFDRKVFGKNRVAAKLDDPR